MKSIKNEVTGEIRRVSELLSNSLPKGWVFISKSEWKKNVRDFGKSETNEKPSKGKSKRVRNKSTV